MYGPWTARSVHHDQDTNLFMSSPKGHNYDDTLFAQTS